MIVVPRPASAHVCDRVVLGSAFVVMFFGAWSCLPSSSGDLGVRTGCASVTATRTMVGPQVVMAVTAQGCRGPDGRPLPHREAVDRLSQAVWRSLQLPVDAVHIRVPQPADTPVIHTVVMSARNWRVGSALVRPEWCDPCGTAVRLNRSGSCYRPRTPAPGPPCSGSCAAWRARGRSSSSCGTECSARQAQRLPRRAEFIENCRPR